MHEQAPMRYSLIIFDWDGTLMDSTGRIVSCLARAAADVALPPLPPSQLQSIIGLGLYEAIRVLYPAADEVLVEAMRERYAVHFIAAEQQPSPLFPGALHTLEALRAQGLQLAVATGKSRKGLDRVWRNTGLDRYFHTSRCADETRSKPHPDMVHAILDELACPPARALVVGDTGFDMEMAARAGVDRVGVVYGAHEVALLEPHGPLALLERIDALLPWLGLPQAEPVGAVSEAQVSGIGDRV